MGFYFDASGQDAIGGKYDDAGYYVGPEGAEEKREKILKQIIAREDRDPGMPFLSKAEIEAKHPSGKYDEDDFYLLEDGSFYDPLGYFFDQDGFDEVFGFYDEHGYYVAPEEEYENDEYGDEEDDGQDAQLRREVEMSEHITPGQLFIKSKLKENPGKNLLVCVSNIPELYQEKNMERFFKQKIANFECSKLILDSLVFQKRRVQRGVLV